MGFRVTVTVTTPELKYSKDMLVCIQSWTLYSCNSIKTFYFSTLYTTITHTKLRKKMELVQRYCIRQQELPTGWEDLVLRNSQDALVAQFLT